MLFDSLVLFNLHDLNYYELPKLKLSYLILIVKEYLHNKKIKIVMGGKKRDKQREI